jgi:hypothetical protein
METHFAGSRSVPIIIVLASIPFVGCKPSQRMFREQAGYIIGTSNDIRPIGDTEKASISEKHLNAAVLLTTVVDGNKRKFCSGTLLAAQSGKTANRIITNHHCFASDEESDTASKDKNISLADGRCEDVKVFFGYVKSELDKRETRDCEPGTLRFDLEADLAIFDLTKNPSERFAPAEIYSGSSEEVGRKASVVHFPNITEGDMSNMVFEETVGYKLPIAQLTLDNCATLGPFSPDEWYLDTTLRMGIKHTCDQKKGSSGSSLWDVETDKVLGVNWGGITLNYSNPDRTEIFNVATEAEYLTAFIGGNVQHLLQLKEQKKADAAAQAKASAESSKESKSSRNLNIKNCGVIGSAMSLSHILVMWGLLGLPLGCLLVRSRRRRF